jgi:ABC-type lipoprotein release transport system permease subunit
MQWLQHHMVEAWAGLAVLLAVLELTSLDLVLAMCAAGATIGVIAAIVISAITAGLWTITGHPVDAVTGGSVEI